VAPKLLEVRAGREEEMLVALGLGALVLICLVLSMLQSPPEIGG
jgi:hypothetical protein